MNNPLLTVESARFAKMRRRWTMVLGVLMTINLCVVVIAVAGYSSNGELPAQASSNAGPSEAQTTLPLAADNAASDPSPGEQPSAQGDNLDGTAAADVEAACPLATTVQPQVPEASEPASEDRSDAEVVSSPAPPAASTEATNVVVSTAEGSTLTPTADVSLDPLAVVFVNPHENGGTVYFVFQELVHALDPGEYVELSACDDCEVSFHRGDELSDTDCTVSPGVYAFEVSSDGWSLREIADDKAAQLISVCTERRNW